MEALPAFSFFLCSLPVSVPGCLCILKDISFSVYGISVSAYAAYSVSGHILYLMLFNFMATGTQ